MIKQLFEKYKEIINYLIFGVLATVLNIVLFKIFDMILGNNLYLISNIISWTITVVFAFLTNKLCVFKSKSWEKATVLKEISTFIGARIFSLVVEEIGLWFMIDVCNIGQINLNLIILTVGGNMIAKIITQIIVVILNYIFSKLVIFKKDKNIENQNEK